MKYRFKAKRADNDEYTPDKYQFVEGYYIEVKPFNGDTIPYIITDLNDEIEVLRDTVELINNPLAAENKKLKEEVAELNTVWNTLIDEKLKLKEDLERSDCERVCAENRVKFLLGRKKDTIPVPRELSDDDIEILIPSGPGCFHDRVYLKDKWRDIIKHFTPETKDGN